MSYDKNLSKYLIIIGLKMTVIFMDFRQNLCDHMPEKRDPIAHNGKQNLLVCRILPNLLMFLQGELVDIRGNCVDRLGTVWSE